MVSTRKGAKKGNKEPPKAKKAPAHKVKSVKKSEKKAKAAKVVAEKKVVARKVQSKKSDKKVEKKSVKKPEKKPVKKVEEKKAPARVAAVKKPAGSSYVGYTPDQYKKFVEYREDLDQKTIADLKELCRKNGQKVTGTKPELIERVADGKVLGGIPKCSSCGGGRPKWDAKSGTYTCPGYMEDSDFINCRKRFTMSDITRTSWQD